jgi:glycolate oxidase iron-sulfur subunit
MESLRELLFNSAHENANRCVQCGYCLPVCPTYLTMGKESASPRGRINLVRLAAEGQIEIGEHLAQPLDLCLGCRACEVACPVNVPYGSILEAAKEAIALHQQNASELGKSVKSADGRLKRKVTSLVLRKLFPYPRRLRLAGSGMWLYQRMRLGKLVRASKILERRFAPLAAFERVIPEVESPFRRYRWGEVFPAKGGKKARVAFFAGCVMDAMMSRINRQTIELLTMAGLEVIVPKGQICCGALHAHQGYTEQAREHAKRNIEAFEAAGADYYVNNAGGCGAMLKEYPHMFQDDPKWCERARQFAARSKDITQLLVEFGPLPYVKPVEAVVTYQDSCHLRNVQGVSKEPRQLIQSIPGVKFAEMEQSELCCASGGIYNLQHYQESMQILDGKMEKAKKTKADIIVTTNPGCMLQMKLGVDRAGMAGDTAAVHLVELLAEACGIGQGTLVKGNRHHETSV